MPLLAPIVAREWEHNEGLLMCMGGWLVLSFVRMFALSLVTNIKIPDFLFIMLCNH